MSRDINALREALFDVLEGLKSGSLDVERAKAINETAQVLVNTAKAEIDYLKAVEATSGTGFIQADVEPMRSFKLIPKGKAS